MTAKDKRVLGKILLISLERFIRKTIIVQFKKRNQYHLWIRSDRRKAIQRILIIIFTVSHEYYLDTRDVPTTRKNTPQVSWPLADHEHIQPNPTSQYCLKATKSIVDIIDSP
jgi:hypothetical protein|tara:strand:- start:1532 stop:1867 length:336 start_codon:yes stop_codon:yes gene_type:complete